MGKFLIIKFRVCSIVICFLHSCKIEATPNDMWTSFKRLNRIVETYLSKRAPESLLANLELALQKLKSDFVNLLKNSVSCIFGSLNHWLNSTFV